VPTPGQRDEWRRTPVGRSEQFVVPEEQSVRSIAHQTDEELGGPGSVLVRQRADHIELDRLLHELDGATGAAQEEVLNRIDRLVFSHAFAEETVIWPAVRRALPDGEALTLEIEKEHQEVNELVDALERGGPDHPERPALLRRLTEALQADVRDEEDVLFPRLQEKLSVAELRALGRRWELMRRISPTRAHPTVSRRPPGNALSGLPLSLIDRTRDAVDAGVRRAPDRLVPAGRALSKGLASVAGLVERVPLSRKGDRPPTSR
jgi:hemerythrin superfamily protein